MSGIGHLLVCRISDSLNTHMVDEVSDALKASLVQPYRFQGSPEDYPINIYITRGNPADPNVLDGRIDMESNSFETMGMRVPAGEIGGGHLWWRRGRAVVECFFINDKYDQLTAAEYASIVLGRVEYFIERTSVSDLVDEFGERAHHILIYASSWSQSGGPPDQYIWRGEVLWQALTQRPY